LLTDGVDLVVDLIKKNVERNARGDGILFGEKLEWGLGKDLDVIKEKYGANSFDLIVGSDIIYSAFPHFPLLSLFTFFFFSRNWESSILPLWVTVDSLLSFEPAASFYCCFQVRAKETVNVLLQEGKKKGFDFRRVQLEKPKTIPTNRDFEFFIFTRVNKETGK